MIARSDLAGQRSPGYIALYLDIQPNGRHVWCPVVDDAQGVVEMSRAAAVRACIHSMDERFTRLRADIAFACTQTRSSQPDDTVTLEWLLGIEARAAGLHREVARLLDEPTEVDDVRVATEVRPVRLSPHQIKAGRALAGLGLRDLAALTDRSVSTLQAIETGSTRHPRRATLDSVRDVLTDMGVEFGCAGWVRHRDDGDTPGLASST